MSPLPQRKKTAEEIAKLRESLGIPDAAPPPPSTRAMGTAPPPAELPPPPVAAPPPPPEPVLAREDTPSSAALGTPAPAIPVPQPEPTAPPTDEEVRIVRSLRKSERLPVPRKAAPNFKPAAAGSKLPTGRRSESELNELRRQQAFEAQSPVVQLQAITAGPFLIGIGYFLALAGGVGGLLAAAYIWRKKPRSVHHAGFMATIAFFVIIFGILYLFPQLRNDT